MTRIIAVANQKGGVGKTTTTVNLAAGLARKGRRVLLIDLDPQSNATFAIMGETEPEATVYDVLMGKVGLSKATLKTEMEINLLPSTIDLAGAEIELVSAIGGQVRLRTRLQENETAGYDFILIDAPPSLGFLTINALAAASEVLVPITVSVFALKGLERLWRTIEQVKQNLGAPNLKVNGILCTMTDHTNVAKDIETVLRQQFKELVFNATIPKNIKIEEAHSWRQSIFTYAPNAPGAQAYAQLVEEVLNRG
jgi:chromosome partitioning protein